MVGHYVYTIANYEIKGYTEYFFTVPVEYKKESMISAELLEYSNHWSLEKDIKSSDFMETQLQLLNEKFTKIEELVPIRFLGSGNKQNCIRYVTSFKEPQHRLGVECNNFAVPNNGYHFPHNLDVFYQLYPELRKCNVYPESKHVWQEVKVRFRKEFWIGWHLKLFTTYKEYRAVFPNYASIEKLEKELHHKFKHYGNYHLIQGCLDNMKSRLIPSTIEFPELDDGICHLQLVPEPRFFPHLRRRLRYWYEEWLG